MESICAIKDIYKTLYQFEKTFAEANGITINEAMLLCCLKDGENKSAGMISEYIGLSNSRVSKVITAVEDKKFICRHMNKDDKRQMFFSLTMAGKDKIKQMIDAKLRFEELFEQLKQCMDKI
jgi:Transcriptional regulators